MYFLIKNQLNIRIIGSTLRGILRQMSMRLTDNCELLCSKNDSDLVLSIPTGIGKSYNAISDVIASCFLGNWTVLSNQLIANKPTHEELKGFPDKAVFYFDAVQNSSLGSQRGSGSFGKISLKGKGYQLLKNQRKLFSLAVINIGRFVGELFLISKLLFRRFFIDKQCNFIFLVEIPP